MLKEILMTFSWNWLLYHINCLVAMYFNFECQGLFKLKLYLLRKCKPANCSNKSLNKTESFGMQPPCLKQKNK